MERKAGRTVIGVTGNIASGKNWFCERVSQAATNIHHMDVDKLAHRILFNKKEFDELPVYRSVRDEVRNQFLLKPTLHAYTEVCGAPLSDAERIELGNQVFADAGKREKLNAIMYQPLMTLIRHVAGINGLILLNAALLAEFQMTHICNNNVILVTTDEKTRVKRLIERGLNNDQIKHRLQSQYTDERKRYHIEQAIKRDHYGKIIEFDNSGVGLDGCTSLYERIVAEFKL